MAVLKYYDETTATWEALSVMAGGGGGGDMQLHFEKVSSLPTAGAGNTIYLVPSALPDEDDRYYEYVFENGEWEKLGFREADAVPEEQIKTLFN